MTDEDFIDKFNNYISNYGITLVDISNIEKYAEKYNIIIKEHQRKSFIDLIGKSKYCFYNKDRDSFLTFYPSIDILIKGNDTFWSLFEVAERELKYHVKYYDNDILMSLLNIKGNSKEEICLKIQMMGY